MRLSAASKWWLTKIKTRHIVVVFQFFNYCKQIFIIAFKRRSDIELHLPLEQVIHKNSCVIELPSVFKVMFKYSIDTSTLYKMILN